MIPILILAAGRSARMRGRDKLLEDVDGVPLLRRQANAAIETGMPVFIALSSLEDQRQAVIADLPVVPLLCTNASDGMSGTLRDAVAQLPPCAAFLIMLADLVELQTAHLRAMLDARSAHPDRLIWQGATESGAPGHPVLFADALRPEFETLSGDTGAQQIVTAHRDHRYLVMLPENVARTDLDTPEDWTAWRAARR